MEVLEEGRIECGSHALIVVIPQLETHEQSAPSFFSLVVMLGEKMYFKGLSLLLASSNCYSIRSSIGEDSLDQKTREMLMF